MKYFKTYEAYRRGVNGVGSLKNSLAALKRQNITGRYTDAETLAKGIRNEYEAITGEKYEDEVQMSMDDAIADIVSHFKLDGPEFMAAWDKVVKESYDGIYEKVNLKADHLSSAEYQKAKKLKDFNKDDWSWNSDTQLYDKITEARNKKVDKKMWNKMSDEKRFDALLSVIKDPDDAEKYVDSRWEDLPSGFERDMILFEKRINLKQAADYEKKLKKAVPSVTKAKAANHRGEVKLFVNYTKFADRAKLKAAGQDLGLTYISDGRSTNRPYMDWKAGDKMVGGSGVLGITDNWMGFIKE